MTDSPKRVCTEFSVASATDDLVRFEVCHIVLGIAELFEMILSFLAHDQQQLCTSRLVGRAWARTGARLIRTVFYSFEKPVKASFVDVFTEVRRLEVKIADRDVMLPNWSDFVQAHETLEVAALRSPRDRSFLTRIRNRNPTNIEHVFKLNVRCPVEIDVGLYGRASTMIRPLEVYGYQLTVYMSARNNRCDKWRSEHNYIDYDAYRFAPTPSALRLEGGLPFIEWHDNVANTWSRCMFVLCKLREIFKTGGPVVFETPGWVVYTDEDVTEFFPGALEFRPGARVLWDKIVETRELWRCNESKQ
jgi:hypothetical protein